MKFANVDIEIEKGVKMKKREKLVKILIKTDRHQFGETKEEYALPVRTCLILIGKSFIFLFENHEFVRRMINLFYFKGRRDLGKKESAQ